MNTATTTTLTVRRPNGQIEEVVVNGPVLGSRFAKIAAATLAAGRGEVLSARSSEPRPPAEDPAAAKIRRTNERCATLSARSEWEK